MLFPQKGKCAEYVLGVRVMCMCLSGDVLYVGLSSGSVLLIDLQVQDVYTMYMYLYMHVHVQCICIVMTY
jgi:hypothetical protein